MFDKLLQIQKMLKKYTRDGKANYGMYVTLDNLLDNLLPICNELWIVIYHKMVDGNVVTIATTDGKDAIESSFPVNATVPQQIGSAITYAKRYNLWQIFNIVTDEDKDGSKSPKGNAKKVFDDKKMKAMYTRAKGKSKGEVMQYVLKIQSEYTLSDEVKADMDLFLETIK